jgi:membrane protease YdiL (CAAX protease family)
MEGVRAILTHVLVGALLASMVVRTIAGLRMWRRLPQDGVGDAAIRARLYRRSIVESWATTSAVPLIWLSRGGLSAADLGWAVPSGRGALAAYVLALVLLAAAVTGAVRQRRWIQRGHRVLGGARTDLIRPRTAGERRMVVVLSLTAGITEEAVFRGLLMAVGISVYHVPVLLVAILSVALFAAGHAYQGVYGVIGTAALGAAYTAIYELSGSLALPIVLHVCQDLLGLLVVPPSPQPPSTAPKAAYADEGRQAA